MQNQPNIQPSASVILLRRSEGPDNPFCLYLLRRRGKSRFMPNRYVFPGGRVEPEDGQDPMSDPALRICALRELWEEAGVILADDPQKAAAASGPEGQEVRESLQAGRAGLNEAMASLGVNPNLEALIPYARWITPPARNMRFDTMFYMALCPEGQKADSDHKETEVGVWLTPREALEQNQQGEVGLAPPQVRILGELSEYKSLEQLLESGGQRDLSPVRPFLWIKDGKRIILFPHDPEYQRQAPSTPEEPGRPCTAGQATRVVDVEGRWLPYVWPA